SVRRDDAIAGLHLTGQGGKHRGHAARGRARGFGTFEIGHALFEHGNGRVTKARIDEARLGIVEGGLRLLRAVINIAGREVNGFRRLLERRALLTRMDQPRCRAPLPFDFAFVCHRKNLLEQKHLDPEGRGAKCVSQTLLAAYFTWPQAELKSPRSRAQYPFPPAKVNGERAPVSHAWMTEQPDLRRRPRSLPQHRRSF